MKNYKLEEKLNKYILNPRSARANFDLGNEYYDLKQYASAISYYLRCAELSDNDDLVYESLLYSWVCMHDVKGRVVFEKGQIEQTIAQSPHRPEAYFIICSWLEDHGEGSYNSKEELFHQMYVYACIGIHNNMNNKVFKKFDKYPGLQGLLFYKAFAGWQIGKITEAEDIFVDLYNNHNLSVEYREYVLNNIKNLGIEYRINENE
tara:strand:+ start:1114 stop:1728 length:615 start_codon:yes stop_codon:yes gene_type:complete